MRVLYHWTTCGWFYASGPNASGKRMTLACRRFFPPVDFCTYSRLLTSTLHFALVVFDPNQRTSWPTNLCFLPIQTVIFNYTTVGGFETGFPLFEHLILYPTNHSNLMHEDFSYLETILLELFSMCEYTSADATQRLSQNKPFHPPDLLTLLQLIPLQSHVASDVLEA
ncbi:hypothetical protein CEXT_282021 [Caerostris extrusa]|uniref:Uncharacterized protein n=1 Tax=Caerostris extrusa TaxID=172846 RepID=A0AAV4MY55_CAEEX|nr:hypothetical protein CEXT_282021 [Caerostris extrusa]